MEEAKEKTIIILRPADEWYFLGERCFRCQAELTTKDVLVWDCLVPLYCAMCFNDIDSAVSDG